MMRKILFLNLLCLKSNKNEIYVDAMFAIEMVKIIFYMINTHLFVIFFHISQLLVVVCTNITGT